MHEGFRSLNSLSRAFFQALTLNSHWSQTQCVYLELSVNLGGNVTKVISATSEVITLNQESALVLMDWSLAPPDNLLPLKGHPPALDTIMFPLNRSRFNIHLYHISLI
jgi:hypothetical protein